MTQKDKPIAFQGEMGANSHIACNDIFPDRDVLPCTTFEGAFKAVENGSAALAVLPVENTVAGRVADIHRLCRVIIFILSENILCAYVTAFWGFRARQLTG